MTPTPLAKCPTTCRKTSWSNATGAVGARFGSIVSFSGLGVGSGGRAVQPEVLAQGAAFIVGPEVPAFLQFRDELAADRLEPAGVVGGIQVEAVARAGAEPVDHGLGDLAGRAGHPHVAGGPGPVDDELTQGQPAFDALAAEDVVAAAAVRV